MALKNNTWKLNQWYDQDVAGNVSYGGEIQLFSLGSNEKGMLGHNNEVKYSSPTQVPGTTWSKDSFFLYNSSAAHSINIKTDGTLWAMGGRNDDWGQLGQNNRTNYSSPVQIGSGTDWSKGGNLKESSWGIKTDGTLWVWGNNQYAVLGQNQPYNSHRSSPVQIPGTTWKRCSGLGNAVFATKTDGTMWVWGNNSIGALGQNNRTQRSSPVQVGDADWSVVSGSQPGTGGGIKTDGTLYMWGSNPNGGLGQNNRTNYSSPTQIPGTTWSSLSLGNKKSAAIKTDGTLWVWGRNAYGSLGLNQADTAQYSSPVQLPGTNWSSVSNAYQSTFAQKTDGTLWSWGYNYHGVLGQNNRTSYSSPAQIPGTEWVHVQPQSNGAAVYATKEI
jgi:alpha-tubulin suppressor-like RCC1 family protein